VAPALYSVAISIEAALALAADILAEIKACQQDPFLAPLLDPNLPVAQSEWLLEARHSDNTLYRGQIDRVVFDGDQWWLLDYKTSRPAAGVDWEDFIAAEVEHYRPQLLAYREMAAKFFEVEPPELIHTVLYFTACRRHVLL
jgi:ATP-dependent helicase/nuclease subunit A